MTMKLNLKAALAVLKSIAVRKLKDDLIRKISKIGAKK